MHALDEKKMHEGKKSSKTKRVQDPDKLYWRKLLHLI